MTKRKQKTDEEIVSEFLLNGPTGDVMKWNKRLAKDFFIMELEANHRTMAAVRRWIIANLMEGTK